MNGEIDAFIVKRSAGYKTAEHCKKYQICMQDKLHAGQYSHFPEKEREKERKKKGKDKINTHFS